MIYFWWAWVLASVAYAAHSAVTVQRQKTRVGRRADVAEVVFGLGSTAWGLMHVIGRNSVWAMPLGLLALIGLIASVVTRQCARRRGGA